MTNITLPYVNLNGTSSDSLMEQARAVRDAANALAVALAAAAPHGRDYQTAPAGTYDKARDEWVARYKAVNAISVEYMDIMIHIHEHMMARKRQAT